MSDLKKIPQIAEIRSEEKRLVIFTSNATDILPKIFHMLPLAVRITSISMTRPTLDDVFISYTGHEIRDGQKQDKQTM